VTKGVVAAYEQVHDIINVKVNDRNGSFVKQQHVITSLFVLTWIS
jgi:hypothetical protein